MFVLAEVTFLGPQFGPFFHRPGGDGPGAVRVRALRPPAHRHHSQDPGRGPGLEGGRGARHEEVKQIIIYRTCSQTNRGKIFYFFAATAWRLLADSDPPPERYLFHILLWGKTSLKRTIFKGLAHRTYGLQRHSRGGQEGSDGIRGGPSGGLKIIIILIDRFLLFTNAFFAHRPPPTSSPPSFEGRAMGKLFHDTSKRQLRHNNCILLTYVHNFGHQNCKYTDTFIL